MVGIMVVVVVVVMVMVRQPNDDPSLLCHLPQLLGPPFTGFNLIQDPSETLSPTYPTCDVLDPLFPVPRVEIIAFALLI